jgi:hypothetical protein
MPKASFLPPVDVVVVVVDCPYDDGSLTLPQEHHHPFVGLVVVDAAAVVVVLLT